MSRRRRVVRELMHAYRNMPNSDLNKEEIKKCLITEMEIAFPNMEVSEHLLMDWMDNEFRCELEEKMEAFVSASFPNDNPNGLKEEMVSIKIPLYKN